MDWHAVNGRIAGTLLRRRSLSLCSPRVDRRSASIGKSRSSPRFSLGRRISSCADATHRSSRRSPRPDTGPKEEKNHDPSLSRERGACRGIAAYASVAHAQGGPPGTVGRLAFTEGSVSFHDQDDVDWTKAVVNTPLTLGDGIWTEPGARSELSVAGARIRLDGGTQLDLLALDDSQTRLQLGRGRLDIKIYELESQTPYRIVTPRGTITLRHQGDYYVEAGSTEDATRLGVRSGNAEIQSLNGETMTIFAGKVGEIYGDVRAPQLRTLNTAPPALPASWADRDRQVRYDCRASTCRSASPATRT